MACFDSYFIGAKRFKVLRLSQLAENRAQREPHESLCWALTGNRAIRQGDWKLNWGASDRKWELYNLADDRTETNDLSKSLPQRVAAMGEAWERWAEKIAVSAK